jgi:hypothetical protein
MSYHHKTKKTVIHDAGEFTLPRRGKVDLVFTGKHVLDLEELEIDEADDYVGATRISQALALYKTGKESYILVRSDGFSYLLSTPLEVVKALENGGKLGEFEKLFLAEAAALDAGIATVAVEVI